MNFAPLEVAKEIRVPLLASSDQRPRQLFIELSRPSPGYAVISSATIQIAPAVQIASESFRLRYVGTERRTYAIFGLRYARPWAAYGIESSGDLEQWQNAAGVQPLGETVLWTSCDASGSHQFFRAFELQQAEQPQP